MVKLEDEVSRVDRASARARRDANETRRTLARDGLLTVARELRRLSALRRGLRAFAVAHNRLACDPKKIGTLRDGKLTGAIRESIRCATLIGEDAPPECEYVADALEKIGQCDDVDRPEPICVW